MALETIHDRFADYLNFHPQLSRPENNDINCYLVNASQRVTEKELRTDCPVYEAERMLIKSMLLLVKARRDYYTEEVIERIDAFRNYMYLINDLLQEDIPIKRRTGTGVSHSPYTTVTYLPQKIN